MSDSPRRDYSPDRGDRDKARDRGDRGDRDRDRDRGGRGDRDRDRDRDHRGGRADRDRGERGGRRILYVNGLPSDIREREVDDKFGQYGKIRRIDIPMRDDDNTRAKGFAFVEFFESRDADDAIHGLDGRRAFGGRTIDVEFAKRPPRRDRSPRRERDTPYEKRKSSSEEPSRSPTQGPAATETENGSTNNHDVAKDDASANADADAPAASEPAEEAPVQSSAE